MSSNMSFVNYPKSGLFVREMNDAGKAHGTKNSFVNINDIASLEQISSNHWQGYSKSGAKNLDGSERVYHFDGQGAARILNYMA